MFRMERLCSSGFQCYHWSKYQSMRCNLNILLHLLDLFSQISFNGFLLLFVILLLLINPPCPPSHATAQWGGFIAPLISSHVSWDNQVSLFHDLFSDSPPSINHSSPCFATGLFHIPPPDSPLSIHQVAVWHESPDIHSLHFFWEYHVSVMEFNSNAIASMTFSE